MLIICSDIAPKDYYPTDYSLSNRKTPSSTEFSATNTPISNLSQTYYTFSKSESVFGDLMHRIVQLRQEKLQNRTLWQRIYLVICQ